MAEPPSPQVPAQAVPLPATVLIFPPHRELANPLVIVVGERHRRTTDCESEHLVHLRTRGQAAVSGKTAGVVARYRADLPVGFGHFANHAIAVVGYEQIPGTVRRNR